MGIKTLLAALCCTQIVIISASSINTIKKVEPKKTVPPFISRNSTATTTKSKNQTTLIEDSEYYEQYEDRLVDTLVMEAIATEQIMTAIQEQPIENTEAVAVRDNNENNDGRSAYINNQFVSDEQLSHVNSAPPLYEMLQQQMQQVLEETEPEYSIYPLQEEKESFKKQNATTNNYSNDDPDEQTMEKKEENDSNNVNGYQVNQVPFVELPKPLYVMNTTTVSPLLSTSHSEITSKPSSSVANCQLEMRPSPNAITSNDKNPVTYQTVSTSSQFVSTPLADLILKFSIGIVNPLKSSYFEDDNTVQQNYNEKVVYKGPQRKHIGDNKNRAAKYHMRKSVIRPSEFNVNS